MLLLRWRLFVNSLRRPNRRAELGLQVLWVILGSMVVLLLSAAFFGGTVALFQGERADFLDLLLLALFLIWQLAPILLEGYSPGLNFREVARYPIAFRTYFLLNLAYGLSDPAAIACVLWLLSIWLAVLVARPDLALAAALAFLLFAAFNLFCNRIIVGLFERFQSTRKGRERMVIVMLLLLLLPQLLQFATGAWAREGTFRLPGWLIDAIGVVREYFPPGLATRVFLYSGSGALLPLAGLLLCVALFLLILLRQLRAVFLGEIYAETYKVQSELRVRPGWKLPMLDDLTSAIVEKELRYIRQNSRLMLQLIYPPIIFVLLAFYGPGRKMSFVANPAGLWVGFVIFLLLSLPNMAYNVFGLDKEGFGRWLLTPMPLRKVFLAKNITHGGILTFLFFLVTLALVVVAPISLLQIATVTAGFFAVLVIQLAAGNMASVHWPRRIDLTQMASRMASNAAGFISLLVFLPLVALLGMTFLAARYWHLPWLPLAMGLAVLAGGLKLYSYLLDQAASYTYAHIEEIAGNLGA